MAKQGITNFRSEILAKGIQVASHFEFSLDFPPLQPNEKRDKNLQQITLRCESISLPDLSINTMENHRFGFGTQDVVPYALSYFETVATFIGDQEGKVYELFYNWFNLIMKMPAQPTAGARRLRSTNEDRGENNLEDYEVGFKKDIVVDKATITSFNHVGDPIYTVTLFDVFPRSITTTTLNWAAGDELVRYTTFLSFKDFKIDFHKLPRQQNSAIAFATTSTF